MKTTPNIFDFYSNSNKIRLKMSVFKSIYILRAHKMEQMEIFLSKL